jgi:phage shock protein PspC (stress-responsive transcriptional regulator)
MNEITRIHIAKIPLDIEVAAKHEIEKYFKELENYANDQELMQDIEIRITELLEQRGVTANGVVTLEDVNAIKKQLGEPSDFRSDESTDNFEKNQINIPRKKLYRDKENGIFGGVLSGLANYFNIDPIWMRLGFVILLFPSGGSLLLLYILFWLIIPPARTAVEKIQMTGKNVNLDSIREFNESAIAQELRHQRADITRRVIATLFGCVFLVMSVASLLVTIFASLGISSTGQIVNIMQIGSGWGLLAAFVLAVLSGLLLTLLFAVCSYASFVRKFSHKIGISVSVIVALGIVSFGSAAGIAMLNPGDQISSKLERISISVPSEFSSIKTFESNTSLANVNYIVSNNPKIIFQTLDESNRPVITVNGGGAKLTLKDDGATNHWLNTQSTITVYGPKLDNLNIDDGTFSYSANQQDLSINIKGDNSVLNLENGTFNILSIVADGNSSVDATNVTANDVAINQKLNTNIYLGHVRTLSVVQPQTCPSEVNTTTEVKGVFVGKISYNGVVIGVENHNNECGSMIIN